MRLSRVGVALAAIALLLLKTSAIRTSAEGATPKENVAAFPAGRWVVVGVKVSLRGIQARVENDPDFMGRRLTVTEKAIRLGDQRCADPRYVAKNLPAGKWFAEVFGSSPGDFGLSVRADGPLEVTSIACRSGNIGPAAAGNSAIVRFPNGQIGMSYFDGTLLLLERVER